jgi:uncharacterized membrane protein YbhN (UPF0104 family)
LGLVSIQFFLAGLRVSVLLKSAGINVSPWRCSLYNAVGIFFSIFLPGGISGDLARAYYFLRCDTAKGISKAVVLGVLLTDRIIGSAVMVMIGLGACTLVAGTLGIAAPLLLAIWIAFVVSCLIYLWLCRVDLRQWAVLNRGIFLSILGPLASLLSNMDLRSHSRKTLAISLALSLGIHLSVIALISSFADILKSGLSFWQIMGLAPFGLLVNMIPLSPGGLGIGEQGFQSLFAIAGGSQGGNTFLLSRIFFSSPALLGLLVLIQSFIKAHRVFRLREFDVPLHLTASASSSKDKVVNDSVRLLKND